MPLSVPAPRAGSRAEGDAVEDLLDARVPLGPIVVEDLGREEDLAASDVDEDALEIAWIAYSLDGTKLAVGIRQFANPPADAALIKILDRTTGTEAATLFDQEQVRTTSYGKPSSLTGIAFVANDATVAVGWANRGVTLFGAADGVATWRFFIAE